MLFDLVTTALTERRDHIPKDAGFKTEVLHFLFMGVGLVDFQRYLPTSVIL